jgi:hypothetical protein
MAESQSHAAGQSYAVRESLKRQPGLDLGVRQTCETFIDAVEFAFDFLDEHDPDREGRVSAIEIVRVGPGASETIWRYEHDGSPDGHQDPKDIWGFDIVKWRGPQHPAAHPA